MEIAGILEAAALSVPDGAAAEGDITLHESAQPGGTATILQVCGPAV
ncbi:hypothetical protein [Streptomyces sirii]